MKKSHKAFDLYNEAGFFQIIEREMPIKIYNRVHTGANIQLGGLKEGLFSCAYHPPMLEAVANPETNPTPRVINSE